MTKIFTKKYTSFRLRATYIVLAACAFSMFFYAVNVYNVIAQTILIQKVESTAASLENQVAILDSKYLDISGKLTPDLISTYGLRQVTIADFISRTPSDDRVALLGHE